MDYKLILLVVFQLMFVKLQCLDQVGEYNGKFFWSERSKMNLSESIAFCDRTGFDVVTISSEGEGQYLLDTLLQYEPDPNVAFWTTGMGTQMLKWEFGEGNVVDQISFNYDSKVRLCLLITNGKFEAGSCDENEQLRTYPLCEMKNA